MNGEFRLGTWLVHPSLNAISQNGVTVHLEPKVMQVLLRLTQQPGELVPKQALLQDVWPDTFVTDDALKRCISELRSALRDEAREPRIIETIPKRGYRLVVAPAEIETPKQNETPAVTASPPGNGSLVAQGSPPLHRRRHLAFGAAVLVIAAVTVLTYLRYLGSPETTIDSVAVMPFVSKGTDATNDVVDGITAGLIDSLSQVPNLRVMARSAVSRYKGQEIDPQKVGRELNVHAVLTGTLTPQGDGVVVDTELVNTSDDSHLWGQQYSAKPSEILTLQADLARAVSSKLRPGLAGETKAKLASPGTSNPEAYALYVKGRYAADRWDAQYWKAALDYFQQAVEKDPAYAQAYAGIGEAYFMLGHFRTIPLLEGVQKARAAGHRALQLNPNLAEGHCALGGAAYLTWKWKEAEEESRLCAELNPNLSFAHQYRAYVVGTQGRMDEALAEQKRVLELDPVSYTGNFFLAKDYYWSKDYQHARAQFLKSMEVEPNSPDLHNDLANLYVMTREYDKAAQEFEKSLALSGQDGQAETLRRAYAKDGVRGLLMSEVELWSNPEKPNDYDPESVAENYAVLGDRDSAFLWLDKAYAGKDTISRGNLLAIEIDPWFDNIRPDPRFTVFLRRMGLPASSMEVVSHPVVK